MKLGYSLIIQLALYAFSAAHVIWVVGTQKIVANLDEAIERLERHTLKPESARLNKINGINGAIRKLLINNSEVIPSRINVILVKQMLRF